MWGRQRRTVLIVSGDSPARGLRAGFLVQRDTRLIATEDVKDAVRIVRRAGADLVILDIEGPAPADAGPLGEVGKEAAARGVPVILVVPPDHDDSRVGSWRAAIVRKPLVQREYFDAVTRFVPLPKRRAPRHAVNLRFTFRHDGRPRQVFCRDLSAQGAFLSTDDVLPLGAHIDVAFRIPGAADGIRCGAIVRRVSEPHASLHQHAGFAIEFEGIDERDIACLEKLVQPYERRALFSR